MCVVHRKCDGVDRAEEVGVGEGYVNCGGLEMEMQELW